jgi:hypothetical protein
MLTGVFILNMHMVVNKNKGSRMKEILPAGSHENKKGLVCAE